MILSKVVLVVIFLLATAQVSAPIDADLQSVSQPISGVVLMLMAGFAPYLTYKAIAFMGFDMYHAMSAEQEAKSSLNRPLPIPLGRRGGAEPSKILDGGTGGGSSGGTPTSGTSGSPSGTAGGASSGGVAAGGAVAAGAVVATEAAAAGPRLGNFVSAAANGHSDASQTSASSPSTQPPQVADSTLAGTSKGGAR
jgi:type IV secretion system protein TrbL